MAQALEKYESENPTAGAADQMRAAMARQRIFGGRIEASLETHDALTAADLAHCLISSRPCRGVFRKPNSA